MSDEEQLKAELEHYEVVADYAWVVLLILAKAEREGRLEEALANEVAHYRAEVKRHFAAIKRLRGEQA